VTDNTLENPEEQVHWVFTRRAHMGATRGAWKAAADGCRCTALLGELPDLHPAVIVIRHVEHHHSKTATAQRLRSHL